jgi:hypothetical protein
MWEGPTVPAVPLATEGISQQALFHRHQHWWTELPEACVGDRTLEFLLTAGFALLSEQQCTSSPRSMWEIRPQNLCCLPAVFSWASSSTTRLSFLNLWGKLGPKTLTTHRLGSPEQAGSATELYSLKPLWEIKCPNSCCSKTLLSRAYSSCHDSWKPTPQFKYISRHLLLSGHQVNQAHWSCCPTGMLKVQQSARSLPPHTQIIPGIAILLALGNYPNQRTWRTVLPTVPDRKRALVPPSKSKNAIFPTKGKKAITCCFAGSTRCLVLPRYTETQHFTLHLSGGELGLSSPRAGIQAPPPRGNPLFH